MRVGDDDPLEGDPGLQLQRTALAWQRTVLATVLVALASGLVWLRLDRPVAGALTAAVLAVPLLTLHRHRVGTGGSPWRGLLALVVGIGVLAASGVVAAVLALRP